MWNKAKFIYSTGTGKVHENEARVCFFNHSVSLHTGWYLKTTAAYSGYTQHLISPALTVKSDYKLMTDIISLSGSGMCMSQCKFKRW